MWVRRVSELHVENERLAAEIVAARAAQDHAAGEKAELERQFAAYRRVSEQRLAAATAEAAAASKGRDDIMAEVVAAERRAKDQEAVAELLESRVRALLDGRSVAEASRVSSSQCAASSPESRAPEVTTEPAGVAFPDNKGTIRRLVPKRLPQPRSAD
jgi:hypothetical protein